MAASIFSALLWMTFLMGLFRWELRVERPEVEMGQNPVPQVTLKSLLKGGNHPQKGTLGFDPQPSLFAEWICISKCIMYIHTTHRYVRVALYSFVWSVKTNIEKTWCISKSMKSNSTNYVSCSIFIIWSKSLKIAAKPGRSVTTFWLQGCGGGGSQCCGPSCGRRAGLGLPRASRLVRGVQSLQERVTTQRRELAKRQRGSKLWWFDGSFFFFGTLSLTLPWSSQICPESFGQALTLSISCAHAFLTQRNGCASMRFPCHDFLFAWHRCLDGQECSISPWSLRWELLAHSLKQRRWRVKSSKLSLFHCRELLNQRKDC